MSLMEKNEKHNRDDLLVLRPSIVNTYHHLNHFIQIMRF